MGPAAQGNRGTGKGSDVTTHKLGVEHRDI